MEINIKFPRRRRPNSYCTFYEINRAAVKRVKWKDGGLIVFGFRGVDGMKFNMLLTIVRSLGCVILRIYENDKCQKASAGFGICIYST